MVNFWECIQCIRRTHQSVHRRTRSSSSMGSHFPLLIFQALVIYLGFCCAKKDDCGNTYGDDGSCELWARQGQCEITAWMLDNCERACGRCAIDESEDVKFQRILDEFYDFRSREFPEYATFVGDNKYGDTLESFKLDAFENRKNETEGFLGRLKNMDRERLTKTNQREQSIFISFLQTFVDGFKWHDYGALTSINFLQGLADGPQWPFFSRLETEQDFDNYIKRLTLVPGQINDLMGLMTRAISLNRSSHIVSINRVPKMMSGWNASMYFFAPFQMALARNEFSSIIKIRLLENARAMIPHIDQALNRLKSFISKDYMEATREQPGVFALTDGVLYYQACLKWYVGYDVTAEEVFELGLKEVARIEKEIEKIMSSVGFVGDLKSFFKYVRTIPTFYNYTKDQLLEKYESLIDVDIIPSLDEIFYNVSISPIRVSAVDTDGPWGLYGSSVFYVNLKDPMERSTFTMMPLTLHEAYPGHHFQNQYSQHFDIPQYRARPMNGRLYGVPFLFPVYSAFSEGWATYAEYLGHELGLYRESYGLFGRYVSEIFRACRLVVDTGIHAFGWSRSRAIDFLSGYSDFPMSQITAEVDRYITVPGQACAYKVGEIKIKSIRQKAEKALGERFDVKEFHHQILTIGLVPLDILEEIVDEWIQSKLTSDPQLPARSFNGISKNNSGEFITFVSKILLLCCLVISC